MPEIAETGGGIMNAIATEKNAGTDMYIGGAAAWRLRRAFGVCGGWEVAGFGVWKESGLVRA